MRAQILLAAQEVVRLQGAEQLSLRSIAEQLDVTAASLYRYFESKEALVSALVAESQRQLREMMEQVPAGLPAEERLIELGLRYLAFARSSPALFQLAFTDSPSLRAGLSDPVSPQSPYRLLLDGVTSAAAAGVLHPQLGESPETLAYAIWSLAHGMAVLEATHLRDFPADFASANRVAIRLLIRGMSR